MDQPVASGASDPLAQPVRARAFAFLSGLRRPAPLAEIAAHLGLYPTGVRAHLDRMEGAGLVERRLVRGGRGRPRYEWTVAAGAAPGGEPPSAYAELSGWLAGAIARGATTDEALKDHGRAIGRRLAPDHVCAAPAEAIGDALAAMGFRPRHRVDAGVTTFELCNCPYRDAVHAGGRHVCALHAGITDGLLEGIAPGSEVTAFVAKDPDEGGCLVAVAGLPSAAPSG